MSIFTDGMDAANVAFGTVAGESFVIDRGGTPGTYTAISIDDLSETTALQPGGTRNDNDVSIHLLRSVCTASGIIVGSVVVVRGQRARVVSFTDDGDNTLAVICSSAGVKF